MTPNLLVVAVTAFDMSDTKKFTSDMWQILKAYMYMCDTDAMEKRHYICQYCRPILNTNNMPNRCVLNGLEVEPIPVELQNLDPLSKQHVKAPCSSYLFHSKKQCRRWKRPGTR